MLAGGVVLSELLMLYKNDTIFSGKFDAFVTIIILMFLSQISRSCSAGWGWEGRKR